MSDKISKAIEFLKKSFEVSEYWKKKPEAKRYRYDHSIRVAKIGAKIAEADGLDRDDVVVACLLHDCSYGLDFEIKDSFTYKEPAPELENLDKLGLIGVHGYISALHSISFLKELGYTGEKLEEMILAIGHTAFPEGAKFQWKDTVLTKTIRDADEIDHVSPFRFYEDLSNFNFCDETQENRQKFVWDTKGYLDYRMTHMYLDLRTETARKLYKENIDFRMSFMDGLQKLVKESCEEGL